MLKHWRVEVNMRARVSQVMRDRSGWMVFQRICMGKGEVPGLGSMVCWRDCVKWWRRWSEAQAIVARVEREGCGVDAAWCNTRKASASAVRVEGQEFSLHCSSVTETPKVSKA